MSSPAPQPILERTIYRAYDELHRLRLAANVARVFLGLNVVVLAFIVALAADQVVLPPPWHGANGQLFGGLLALFVAATLLDGLALAGEWLRRVDLTTNSILAAFVLTMLGFVAIVSQRGLLPVSFIALAGLTLPIVLGGLLRGELGVRWLTGLAVGSTVLVALIVRPAPAGTIQPGQVNILTLIVLVIQAACAALMVILARGLEATLRELGDVRVAFERARQLDDLKDQFIASVNHELRNPLMALQAQLELLDAGGESLPAANRADLVARANQVGNALVTLVDSILDARRFDQGAKDFSPAAVPVLATVQTAQVLVDPREGDLAGRAVRVAMSADLAIWGEATRLQQILTNLLSNAAKYSPPGTPIDVQATVEPPPPPAAHFPWQRNPAPAPRMVAITVRDYGLGVPPEQAPLLFQKFARLARDLRSTTIGNGLGLYLCRVLAEAMGGDIRVESSGVAGEGSTFRLRLPAPPLEVSAPPPADEAAAGYTVPDERVGLL